MPDGDLYGKASTPHLPTQTDWRTLLAGRVRGTDCTIRPFTQHDTTAENIIHYLDE